MGQHWVSTWDSKKRDLPEPWHDGKRVMNTSTGKIQVMLDGADTKEKVRPGRGIAEKGGCYLKPGGPGTLMEKETSVQKPEASLSSQVGI